MAEAVERILALRAKALSAGATRTRGPVTSSYALPYAPPKLGPAMLDEARRIHPACALSPVHAAWCLYLVGRLESPPEAPLPRELLAVVQRLAAEGRAPPERVRELEEMLGIRVSHREVLERLVRRLAEVLERMSEVRGARETRVEELLERLGRVVRRASEREVGEVLERVAARAPRVAKNVAEIVRELRSAASPEEAVERGRRALARLLGLRVPRTPSAAAGAGRAGASKPVPKKLVRGARLASKAELHKLARRALRSRGSR